MVLTRVIRRHCHVFIPDMRVTRSGTLLNLDRVPLATVYSRSTLQGKVRNTLFSCQAWASSEDYKTKA